MGKAVKVVMPQVWGGMRKGQITRWLVPVGAVVERDQALFEISTEKVDAEIPSPHTGVLSRVLYPEGATVPVHAVVALVDDRSEANSGKSGVTGEDVSKLIEQVRDAETFLVFARALAADRAASSTQEKASPSSPYGSEAKGWENTTIESFLTGAIAWAEASNFGLSQGLSQANPWLQFATFLYSGKIYE